MNRTDAVPDPDRMIGDAGATNPADPNRAGHADRIDDAESWAMALLPALERLHAELRHLELEVADLRNRARHSLARVHRRAWDVRIERPETWAEYAVAVLRAAGRPMRLAEIAAAIAPRKPTETRDPGNVVRLALRDLISDRRAPVRRVGHGWYEYAFDEKEEIMERAIPRGLRR